VIFFYVRSMIYYFVFLFFVVAAWGQEYKSVKIGKQVWMAENLNYNASGSKCYDNKPANCDKYGRLYNWETAKKVCPKGWHLPSKAEWEVLTASIGGEDTGGKYLKAKSGWESFKGKYGNGEDTYGFSALPGGDGDSDDTFYDVVLRGNWWSTSEHKRNSDFLYIRGMGYNSDEAYWTPGFKDELFSVRCLQDD